MSSESSRNTVFPLCQKGYCKKNDLSNRIFWKREFGHQYQFYLASLRAERDVKYLIEEHSNISNQIKLAEATNIDLRKQIRLLQIELYTMFQRNAHDSCVIDGLHEVDYQREETDFLESQIKGRIKFACIERDHEECLLGIIREEIGLLKRKNEEDVKLLALLKPVDNHLRRVLKEEKMKTHQQSKKFQREFEEVLRKFQNSIALLEETKSEKIAEITWAKNIFSELFLVCQIPSETSETSSVRSTQETEHFEVSGETFAAGDLDEKLKPLIEEYAEFVAMKELIDSKNIVTIHLIYDNLLMICNGIGELCSEYFFLFDVITDIAFIREYLKRLDEMRKKQEVPQMDEDRSAQITEDLNVIYNTLLSETAFIDKIIQYFKSTLKDDFEAHCAVLQKTEELFENPIMDNA